MMMYTYTPLPHPTRNKVGHPSYPRPLHRKRGNTLFDVYRSHVHAVVVVVVVVVVMVVVVVVCVRVCVCEGRGYKENHRIRQSCFQTYARHTCSLHGDLTGWHLICSCVDISLVLGARGLLMQRIPSASAPFASPSHRPHTLPDKCVCDTGNCRL